MTVLTFPTNPILGQQYAAPNGIQYVFDGVKWVVETTSSSSAAVTNSTQDRVAPMFVNGVNTGITFAYNSTTNVMTTSVADSDRLVNGANELVLGSTGTVTLPAGGTITEGVVTSNPTIQLTPATPDVASQKLVIKGGGTVDYHLHLTTGDLTETSIFLGTDDHNVRTTVNGGIEITTPNTSNNVWQFGPDGNLTLPNTAVIRTDGNNVEIGGVANFNVEASGVVNIYTDTSGETPYQWQFSDDGSLTLPGDIHGAVVMSSGGFPSPVGRTVNITPADDASDKAFSFRIDQYAGQLFSRAYLELPTAEVDKQVAAVFRHANNTAGYIYTQGADTIDDRLNNAFNIFYNAGDINITAMTPVVGTLNTWKFGDDGSITFPGGASVKDLLGETLEESVLILGAGSTIAENQRAARIGLNGAVSGVAIGAGTYDWSFANDGSLTLPNGMTIETEYGGGARLVIDGKGNFVDIRDSGTILIGYNSTGNVQIGNPEGGTTTEIASEKVIFLGQSVPASSIGVAGDSAGMVAFDLTYIYYCTGLYNGSLNIWKRVAWSADTW